MIESNSLPRGVKRLSPNVLDIVSLLMLRAWQDRHKPLQHHAGQLVSFPTQPQPSPKRRIA